jgi:hypothetical protein
MKRKHVIALMAICAMLFFPSVLGFALDQASGEAMNAVSLNLFMTAAGLLPNFMSPGDLQIPLYLDYRRVLADHFVLFVAPNFLYRNSSGGNGFTIDQIIEVDWHPFDLGMDGVFLGAFLDLSNVYFASIYPINSPTNMFTAGVGLAAGYELTLLQTLLVEISGGLEIAERYDTSLVAPQWALVPLYRVDIGLGYRF